jgi:NADPH:quinone reductase-like Zn-dependent oxidoreductase
MKAMRYLKYASPTLQLREVPEPRPNPRQLLVRVAASSVNPIDWKLRTGALGLLIPSPYVLAPGFDVAGEVVAVGDEATRFKPGDRVYACVSFRTQGTAAEVCVVDEDLAAPMPAGLADREAAGMPLAGLTALQALRDLGHLQAGQRVLVNGASGGVGHYAVQIARNLGAKVTAVCGPANLDWVGELGADAVIDYTRQSLDTGQPYDLVFDGVTTLRSREIHRLLTPAGTYVATLPHPDHILRRLQSGGPRFKVVRLKASGQDLATLAGQAATGRLRTRIDSVYPLDQLAEAYRRSRSGRAAGKIVVDVASGAA